MNQPLRINGHHSAPALDELRAARAYVAHNLYIAIKYLELAHATKTAHALPYALPDVGTLQSALDLINKDISDRENQP